MQDFSINYHERKFDIVNGANCKYFNHIKLYVKGKLKIIPIECSTCQNFMLCSSVADRLVKDKSISITYNSTVRYEPNGVELVVYKDNHFISVKDEVLHNIKKVDLSPLFKLNNDLKYEVCKDNFTYSNFYRSLNNARKRCLQQLYNYALANTWDYFITLTFDGAKVDRYNDIEVKKKWSIFQSWVKKNNPDAKILVVPEYHDKVVNNKRALHFHGFIANVPNLTFTPAVNPKTGEEMFGKYEYKGRKLPILNIKDWKYGFSTAEIIINCNNLRITNYLVKYIKKDESIGYNQKGFYNTRNLDACFVDNLNISPEDLNSVVNTYNLEIAKDTNNLTVYRTKKEVE